MPGQRTVRRRAAGDQASVGRLSDIQGARRRTTGSAGTTAKRRRPEGNKVSAERRRPEGARISTERRRPEEGGSSVERRRPEGSEVPVRRRQRRSSDGGRQARRKQNRRRRKRNLVLKMILFVILLIAAVVGAFLWKKYSPSKEKADLKEYYGIEKEGQLAITINNEITEPHGMISEGKAYVQYETVRDHISNRFYWDSKENKLLYTLPKDIVSVEVGSKDYMVSNDKNSEDYVILKTEGSTAYIALDFIQQYMNIDYAVYENPGRVMIVSEWGETPVAQVKKNTQVRYRGGVKSPVLSEVKKKDEVVVLEEEENWKKVRTKDGFIGYVKNSALKETEKKKLARKFEEPDYTNISLDYTVNLVWHNVTNREANNNVLDKIAETKGLTTIAPTWYHVKNTDGDLESLSSADYVEKARQLKVDVWATVRDFDGGINSQSETYELLSSTSKREKLINQLISDALQTNIAGINVDFEKVSEECGEHYIQFIRELSVRCRQSALVLSVDNYVPKNYNMQYNRKEQGVFADYVIIMGYDEHHGGSPEAGSVSSYNFVQEGIEETLKEVPAEKVISGVPFFTRLWSEKPKTQEQLAKDQGTEAAQYATEVKSEAYGMSKAKEKVTEAGADITWDEEAKQNFATWTDGDTTYKIWLEDVKSLEPKLKLMKEYGLAGSAAWALGQESSDVWPLIQQYVN
ncbi:SH3 domain-containing protein [Lachnospiraceae bacterium MD308]|nr:SH3 domain-containing protein [Lachnospiraceae bacterium MD308]